MPIAPDKTEGPSTSLTFLGIELNTALMSTSLPASKLVKLQTMVREFLGARVVRDKHALESLVGHLVHATKVFPLGKAYLNALFAVKASMVPGQIRRINLEARSELAWWDWLLDNWTGVSVHQFLLLRHPDHHLHTDASGAWGCSAWSLPHWFQMQWSPETTLPSIALKELFPIVMATAMWGHLWAGSLVLCHCDNAAVVSQVNKLHARDPKANHMLRCLAFLQAIYDCRVRAVHVAGVNNPDADALSRNRVGTFIHRHSQASPNPSQVPLAWAKLICQQTPDWTSVHWRAIFSDSWRWASQNQQ